MDGHFLHETMWFAADCCEHDLKQTCRKYAFLWNVKDIEIYLASQPVGKKTQQCKLATSKPFRF